MSTEPRRRFGRRMRLSASLLSHGAGRRRARRVDRHRRLRRRSQYPEFVYPRCRRRSRPHRARRASTSVGGICRSTISKNADREFGVALEAGPTFYPARAGSGICRAGQARLQRGAQSFDARSKADAAVRARAGRKRPGAAGLGDKTDLALAAFEAALVVDPSLTD